MRTGHTTHRMWWPLALIIALAAMAGLTPPQPAAVAYTGHSAHQHDERHDHDGPDIRADDEGDTTAPIPVVKPPEGLPVVAAELPLPPGRATTAHRDRDHTGRTWPPTPPPG